MLQQVRMPYVRFESAVAESKDANGHNVYTPIYYAYITPAGGRDEVVKIAGEWINELKRKGDTRGPFDAGANEYGKWHEVFSKMFEAFKAGEEMQTGGTPIRACMAFNKAEVMQVESVKIFSLEDLAACNEEAINRMGVGGRSLKDKAVEILKNSGNSQAAEEMVALREKVAQLSELVVDLQKANLEQQTGKRVLMPN